MIIRIFQMSFLIKIIFPNSNHFLNLFAKTSVPYRNTKYEKNKRNCHHQPRKSQPLGTVSPSAQRRVAVRPNARRDRKNDDNRRPAHARRRSVLLLLPAVLQGRRVRVFIALHAPPFTFARQCVFTVAFRKCFFSPLFMGFR